MTMYNEKRMVLTHKKIILLIPRSLALAMIQMEKVYYTNDGWKLNLKTVTILANYDYSSLSIDCKSTLFYINV